MNKKAIDLDLMGKIIIALLLLLVLSLIFPGFLQRGGSDFFDLACKHVNFPVVCKDREYDSDGNRVTDEDKVKALKEMFNELNNALRDQEKYAYCSVTEAQLENILDHIQKSDDFCQQKLTSNPDRFLLKSYVDETLKRPIYLIVTVEDKANIEVITANIDPTVTDYLKYEDVNTEIDKNFGNTPTQPDVIYKRPLVLHDAVPGDNGILIDKDTYCIDKGWFRCKDTIDFNITNTFSERLKTCPKEVS